MTDSERAAAAHARLDALAVPLLARPGVDWGRMFSGTGLRVRGKVFAVVTGAGELMAKVPEARADELVAEARPEAAVRVVMRGRELREWVALPLAAGEERWRALLEDACAHVDAVTPR